MALASTPLNTFRYTLTAADALAYERLPRKLRTPQTIMFVVWLGLGGFLLAALPPDLAGATWSPRYWATGAALVAVQYAIFVAVRGWVRHRRARFRVPAPREVTVSQWPNRLTVTELGRSRDIEFAAIGALLPTQAHLFIAAGDDLVIMPAIAFGTDRGMNELVEAIDGYMAVYGQDLERDEDREDDLIDTSPVDPDGPNA